MKMTDKKGFTIVELVIVIAVIAILATVLVPTFGGVIKETNNSKVRQEARIAYKEYMAQNAQSGSVGSYFLYISDSGSTVIVVDGSPRGLYESEDEAINALKEEFSFSEPIKQEPAVGNNFYEICEMTT